MDYLIIKNKDDYLSSKEIENFKKYSKNTLDLDYNLDFRHGQGILYTLCDKIKYMYANMFNDFICDSIIKEILNVDKIEVTYERYINKYYLKEWLEELNIDLKEFLLNEKYIIINDTLTSDYMESILSSGLLNYNDIDNILGLEEFKELKNESV